MIKQPTVLILGAGASTHLGYPSGQELINIAISSMGIQLIKNDKVPLNYKQDIGDLINKLKFSGAFSIDAWLEHNKNFIEAGKILISKIITAYEQKDRLFDANNTWYQLIWGKMCRDGFDNIDKNISFVTFNYDRSLEQYLFTVARNTFIEKKQDEIAEKICNIPIVHVHGSVGLLPWQENPNNLEVAEYTANKDIDELILLSNQIKIVSEDITKDEEFQKAQKILSIAEEVYFLGFGYLKTNLERISSPPYKPTMRDLALNLHPPKINTNFYGTGLGLTDKEIGTYSMAKINGFSNNINIHKGYDIVKLIREIGAL